MTLRGITDEEFMERVNVAVPAKREGHSQLASGAKKSAQVRAFTRRSKIQMDAHLDSRWTLFSHISLEIQRLLQTVCGTMQRGREGSVYKSNGMKAMKAMDSPSERGWSCETTSLLGKQSTRSRLRLR